MLATRRRASRAAHVRCLASWPPELERRVRAMASRSPLMVQHSGGRAGCRMISLADVRCAYDGPRGPRLSPATAALLINAGGPRDAQDQPRSMRLVRAGHVILGDRRGVAGILGL